MNSYCSCQKHAVLHSYVVNGSLCLLLSALLLAVVYGSNWWLGTHLMFGLPWNDSYSSAKHRMFLSDQLHHCIHINEKSYHHLIHSCAYVVSILWTLISYMTHRATLGDMAISSNNCIIASWWVMLKKWKL